MELETCGPHFRTLDNGDLRLSLSMLSLTIFLGFHTDTGFPPPLWEKLSEMYNKSQSEYLICYHGPRNIIDKYEFNVELIAQMTTSMHGSKEGHMGYIYKRTKPARKSKSNPCDKLFQQSWKLVQSGLSPLHKDVTDQVEKTMGTGRKTRSRRKLELTRC